MFHPLMSEPNIAVHPNKQVSDSIILKLITNLSRVLNYRSYVSFGTFWVRSQVWGKSRITDMLLVASPIYQPIMNMLVHPRD